MWSEKRRMVEAVKDLRFLLDRGYPRESAVNFVSNHYRLPRMERHLLNRCVFSRNEASRHRAKIIGPDYVRGKILAIDGYNVLITAESILMRSLVAKCDDGMIRDLRAVFGKYKVGRFTDKTLEVLGEIISRAKPSQVRIFFDSPASKSGELASRTEKVLGKLGLSVVARAIRGVDREVCSSDVSASSDRVIVDRARAVWDIPAEVLSQRGGKLIDFSRLG